MAKASVIYVRVEEEVKATIERIAETSGRTQAQVVDYLLRKSLGLTPDAIEQAVREVSEDVRPSNRPR